jgi:hypothetical protein
MGRDKARLIPFLILYGSFFYRNRLTLQELYPIDGGQSLGSFNSTDGGSFAWSPVQVEDWSPEQLTIPPSGGRRRQRLNL